MIFSVVILFSALHGVMPEWLFILYFQGVGMEKGKIIFLNGVSSSGKTTLAKSLQERLTEPLFWLAADTFIDMVPEKYNNPDKPGAMPVCLKAIAMTHHTIKFFSDMGVNVVVEHIFHYKEWVDECVELLHEYPILLVHVTCPIEELRRREKERGNRDIGRAEIQLQRGYSLDTYDITVDTHNNSTEECADKIIEMLDYPEKFTAFKTLWSQRPK